MIKMEFKRNIIITGGAGFIGSHVVRLFVNKYPDYHIINLDKLTYAGNLANLKDVENRPNYAFVKADICDFGKMQELMSEFRIDGIIHLAAESHVDRSIKDPFVFAKTNVLGTLSLLQAAKLYWESLPERYDGKRFYHISTDEVYGALELTHPEGLHSDMSAHEVYGDTFFDVDLDGLYGQHRLYPTSITLALKPMEDFDRYGNVLVNNGLITAFEEKKHCGQGLINGGVYVINRLGDMFNGLPERFSFETDVLQPQCVKGNLYGVVQNGYFIDIGIPEDYARANVELPQLPLFKTV